MVVSCFPHSVWEAVGGVRSLSVQDDLALVLGDRLELRQVSSGTRIRTVRVAGDTRLAEAVLLARDGVGQGVVLATRERGEAEAVLERKDWGTARIDWRRRVPAQ